ncbi:MAG: Ig-like domain-containing protein [Bacteroidales bacterium]|nr:Ig-like domain-containing protein [Bacteroidales bacterium]
MRRIAYAAVMLMGVLTIAGCARMDEILTGRKTQVTFVASFDDATRTSIQSGGKVDWVEGDAIRYYTKKGGSIEEYEVVRSGHSTNVVADVTSGTSYIIAEYGGESITDNGVTSFTINGAVKASQSGKFEDAHVSVAKSFDIRDDASLTFHNMTSLIKFTLERTDVSYITFTAKGGEKIHGDGTLKITFNDDSPSASFGDSGGSTIKVTTGSAGIYFISTLPVKLTSGFAIQYFNASGKCFATTDFSSMVSLKANEILNLGTVDGRMSSKPEYVDLGLSVMWATCNLGALSPEECGGYYQWAGLQDVTSTSINLGWSNCPYHIGSSSSTGWTKYIPSGWLSYWSGTGSPDNKTVLDPEDDVAHVKLGGKWRMPTDAEWTELRDNCTWTWTTQNGVNGYKVTSKKSGYTNKSIFLPAAGYRNDTSLINVGSIGGYWSSSLDTSSPDYAYGQFFKSSYVDGGLSGRYYGRSVRPVYGELAAVAGISLNKTSMTLTEGATQTLTATITPSNATNKNVTWFSSNTSVATVDANGKVTAVKAGTATITAKTADGGKTATCTVTVSAATVAVTGISLNRSSYTMDIGGTMTLTATVLPSNATNKTVSWSTSNSSVATVSNGVVTAKGAGTATITAKTADGNKTASCSITVNASSSVAEYVDLGLSVKWATCNLGASKPEQYGGYYLWAGLQDVRNIGYYHIPYHNDDYSGDVGWEKYNWNSYCGTVDNRLFLALSDDAAYVKLGDKWRIPAESEWRELINNCTGEWTTLNGITGWTFTSKKNGESIFLPAAGYCDKYGKLHFNGERGEYWSSTVGLHQPSEVFGIIFQENDLQLNDIFYRGGADPIRPVYLEKGAGAVTDIRLDKTDLILIPGEIQALTATIVPTNATNQSVTWSSSNSSVATVDASGKVTAVGEGSATITVRATDGGYTAKCSVTVKAYPVPELVDLGLSVKWASCNLGALSPEEYGGYYQWGDLQDVTSISINLDWNNCQYHTGHGWTKYITSDGHSEWSGNGSPDNKTVLDPSDDVAHVKLGGKWRMPTDAEWTELRENCTWTCWVAQNGVVGYKVTSKKAGYTSKSIFLPAAGYRRGTYLSHVGSDGYYWSSSLRTDYLDYAYYFYISPRLNYYWRGYYYRYHGLSVRPVSE